MMKSEASICSFNGGTAGSTAENASGIVIGLDAASISVLSSTTRWRRRDCRPVTRTADQQGNGLCVPAETARAWTGSLLGRNAAA